MIPELQSNTFRVSNQIPLEVKSHHTLLRVRPESLRHGRKRPPGGLALLPRVLEKFSANEVEKVFISEWVRKITNLDQSITKMFQLILAPILPIELFISVSLY